LGQYGDLKRTFQPGAEHLVTARRNIKTSEYGVFICVSLLAFLYHLLVVEQPVKPNHQFALNVLQVE
jgi:hypothetical protein